MAELPDDPSRDALTGVWSHASIASVEPDASVAYIDLLHFRDRVNGPYGHAAGDRVLQAVGRRLQDGVAPNRVFRHGGDEFLIEIAEPLDWMKAHEIANRIKHLVAEPIEGIAEPLEARIGIALGQASHRVPVWAAAVMAGDRAAGYDLPFLVDDGVDHRIDPWEPWWRAIVPESARKDLLPDHPWLLESPLSARAATNAGSVWTVCADLVAEPSWDGRPFVAPISVRSFVRFDGQPVSREAVAGLVNGPFHALEVIPAGTTLRLIRSSGWNDVMFNSVGSYLTFGLPDGRTTTIEVDERIEMPNGTTWTYEWKPRLTWRQFACAAVVVPAEDPLAGDTAASEAVLASIERAARIQPSEPFAGDRRIDPITGLPYATKATGSDARAMVEVLVYHADGRGLHPDSSEGPRVPPAAMRAVAERLRIGLEPSSVYRLGRWDGFHIPLTEPIDEPEARRLGHRIAELVAQPTAGLDVVIGSWIGIALLQPNARDPRLDVAASSAAYVARYYRENPYVVSLQ